MTDVVVGSALAPPARDKIERTYDRLSAMELARRSSKGVAVYPVLAILEIASGRIHVDAWQLSVAAVVFLTLAGLLRFLHAAAFANRFERLGERAVTEFTLLTMTQSLAAGLLIAAIIIEYGSSREAALALLFGAGICAGGTSSLAPRPSVHRLFLASIVVPVIVGGLVGAGVTEVPFLVALVVFAAFLMREGTEAGRAYRDLVTGRIALEEADSEVQSLRDIIPICARCKDIRDGEGYWQKVEAYFMSHGQVGFSHGLCPKCLEKDFPQGD